MGTFIESTARIPRSIGEVICVADDVLLLSMTLGALQSLLDCSTEWAGENRMTWQIMKSLFLSDDQCPVPFILCENDLDGTQEVNYLGLSLSRRSITHTRLLNRIKSATLLFHKIRRSTGITLSSTQKRINVRSLILPTIDYALLLQPYSEEVQQGARTLEEQYLRWILGANVGKIIS